MPASERGAEEEHEQRRETPAQPGALDEEVDGRGQDRRRRTPGDDHPAVARRARRSVPSTMPIVAAIVRHGTEDCLGDGRRRSVEPGDGRFGGSAAAVAGTPRLGVVESGTTIPGRHGPADHCHREAWPAPGPVRFELNRSLTGMGHHRYRSRERRGGQHARPTSWPGACSNAAGSRRCTSTPTWSRRPRAVRDHRRHDRHHPRSFHHYREGVTPMHLLSCASVSVGAVHRARGTPCSRGSTPPPS